MNVPPRIKVVLGAKGGPNWYGKVYVAGECGVIFKGFAFSLRIDH